MTKVLLTHSDFPLIAEVLNSNLRHDGHVPDDTPPPGVELTLRKLNELVEEILTFRWVYMRELKKRLRELEYATHLELMHYDTELFVAGAILELIVRHPELRRRDVVSIQYLNRHGDVLIEFE